MNYIKDLVSVIVPTYNRVDLLPKAIESIQNQTYKNIEVIVIANGCKDNTEKVVNHLQQKYNNIVFLNFKESLGGAEARNKGLDIAKGEFISFLDDDDVWLENKLEKQLEILKNNDYCIVGCNYKIVYENGKKRNIKLPKNITFDYMLYENVLGSYSFCITKKEYIKDMRIDKSLPANQDWDLWLKIFLKTKKTAYITQEYLVLYYQHSNKISKVYKNKILADKIFFNSYKKYFNENQKDFFVMRLSLWNMLDKNNKKDYRANLLKFFLNIIKSPFRFNLLMYYVYIFKAFIK